jgi:hypothetical protein
MPLVHDGRIDSVRHYFMDAFIRVMRGDGIDASTSVSSRIKARDDQVNFVDVDGNDILKRRC